MTVDEINEMKRILQQHEKRISDLEDLTASKPVGRKKELSARELLLQKRPKNDVERTLVLGYYLEQYRNISSFNRNNLEELFREAKEIVPTNINDKINKNIEKGFIMEANESKGELKSWTLTSGGERFVENELGK
jgi:hypothetical protein